MSDLTDRVNERLNNLAGLNNFSWGHYKPVLITSQMIDSAKRLWSSAVDALGAEIKIPRIYPGPCGSLRLEWEREYDLPVAFEIQFFEGGLIKFLYNSHFEDEDNEDFVTEAQAIDLMRRFFAGEVLSDPARRRLHQ